MITGITAGKYLQVDNGGGGAYYNNSSMPMTGMLRYHSGGRVDVFDGNNWQTVSCYPSINLTAETQAAIEWAMIKQREERELEKLGEEHPAIKAAIENVRRAQEQLKATIILSKDEQSTT